MNRIFRKYHRILAIILGLPLLITIISGMAYTVFDEWFDNDSFSEVLLSIHTLKILHLDGIYPVINGLGLLGLLTTGLSMTSLFKQKSSPKSTH